MRKYLGAIISAAVVLVFLLFYCLGFVALLFEVLGLWGIMLIVGPLAAIGFLVYVFVQRVGEIKNKEDEKYEDYK